VNPPGNPFLWTAAGAESGTPEVSIIIVNWNSAEFVKKCLESVYKYTIDLQCEVIVVDGASYDGCGEMIAREFPQVIFIQSERNMGFGRANNLGVERARASTVLFLNPDTELVGPALSILHRQLETLPLAGAVGAKLLNPDRSVQTSCIQATPTILNQALDSDFFRRLFPNAALWGTRALASEGGKGAEVEMLSGACIMAKRGVFEKVGMFSSDYFMYCEDTDLCYKIRAAGYKNYYIPSATIIHYGGGSSQQSRSQFSNVMMRESIWRFFLKTKGRCYGFGYRGVMMLSALCRLALTLASPFRFLHGKGAAGDHSARKWAAILGWSLGAQRWVKKYD
jgi:GT2 family glycosyltransferase